MKKMSQVNGLSQNASWPSARSVRKPRIAKSGISKSAKSAVPLLRVFACGERRRTVPSWFDKFSGLIGVDLLGGDLRGFHRGFVSDA